MGYFAIAGVQMNISALHRNVDAMKYKLDVLMSIYPWVQMVMFSELAWYGPLTRFAQELPGNDEEVFCEMAKKYSIWLLPGSTFEKTADGIYNTATVINPQGEVVGRYRKQFPFLPYEEGVSAGDEFLLFDVPEVGTFGVSICYDIWFPETIRSMVVQGAEVILHPTLTGTIDREIELALVQSMAACNQAYIFDVNGLASGGCGQSIICGPDGRIIYKAGTVEEFIPLEINLENVRRSRKLGLLRLGQPLKSFRDRKVDFEVYAKGKTLPYLDQLGPLIKPGRHKKLEELTHQPPPES